jgi:hypothetical protein
MRDAYAQPRECRAFLRDSHARVHVPHSAGVLHRRCLQYIAAGVARGGDERGARRGPASRFCASVLSVVLGPPPRRNCCGRARARARRRRRRRRAAREQRDVGGRVPAARRLRRCTPCPLSAAGIIAPGLRRARGAGGARAAVLQRDFARYFFLRGTGPAARRGGGATTTLFAHCGRGARVRARSEAERVAPHSGSNGRRRARPSCPSATGAASERAARAAGRGQGETLI